MLHLTMNDVTHVFAVNVIIACRLNRLDVNPRSPITPHVNPFDDVLQCAFGAVVYSPV